MVTNENILETTGEDFLFVVLRLSEQLISSLIHNKCFLDYIVDQKLEFML